MSKIKAGRLMRFKYPHDNGAINAIVRIDDCKSANADDYYGTGLVYYVLLYNLDDRDNLNKLYRSYYPEELFGADGRSDIHQVYLHELAPIEEIALD